MTKDEYLEELGQALKGLPAPEREDILADFAEHFSIGKEQGKTDDEISTSLGSPHQIAKELLASYHVETAASKATAGNVLRATWAVLGLSFFNLVFVLGPFIAVIGLLFGGWVTGIAFTLSPLLVLFDAIFVPDGSLLFDFFASLLAAGLGILLSIAMYFITKWLAKGFVRYLKFNASLVKGGMNHEVH